VARDCHPPNLQSLRCDELGVFDRFVSVWFFFLELPKFKESRIDEQTLEKSHENRSCWRQLLRPLIVDKSAFLLWTGFLAEGHFEIDIVYAGR